MVHNFSVRDLAREHVLSCLDRAASPATKLSELHSLFAGPGAIEAAAGRYVATHNDNVQDADDEIDADDFAAALEDVVNDECEKLLYSLDVAEDLEDAKASLIDNTAWRDYASDVHAKLRDVAEADDTEDDGSGWYALTCTPRGRPVVLGPHDDAGLAEGALPKIRTVGLGSPPPVMIAYFAHRDDAEGEAINLADGYNIP